MADPLIGAAISAAGEAGKNVVAMGQTLINRHFAKKDYKQQRSDNLADWHMQNAYNTPQAQMQRLRDAGLNPNLVYGNGATATAQSPPRSADIQHVQMEPLSFNPDSVLAAYQQTQMQNATIDNMAVQKTVQEAEAILKNAQTLATLATTDKTKTETQTLSELRQHTVDAAKVNVQKLGADLRFTEDSNRRANELHSGNIQTQAQQIIQNRLQQSKTIAETNQIWEAIKNMKKDGSLKEIEIKMREKGINPNDPMWARMLAQYIDEIIQKFKNPVQVKQKPKPKGITGWADRFSPY